MTAQPASQRAALLAFASYLDERIGDPCAAGLAREYAEGLPAEPQLTEFAVEAAGLDIDQQLRSAALAAAARIAGPSADAVDVIELAESLVPWLRDGGTPTALDTASPCTCPGVPSLPHRGGCKSGGAR